MRKCCRGPTPRRKTEEEVQRRPARSAAAGALGGAAAAGDDSGRASASPPFRAVRFSKAKQIGSVVDGVLFSSTTLGFAFLGVNPVESKYSLWPLCYITEMEQSPPQRNRAVLKTFQRNSLVTYRMDHSNHKVGCADMSHDWFSFSYTLKKTMKILCI